MTRLSYASGYDLMWAWVLFDLPVLSKEQRERARKFRSYLLDEGFEMSQFSVYIRVCGNREKMNALFDRVERNVPSQGSVHCIGITDKQFESIRTFHGREKMPIPEPEQLVLL